MTGPAAGGIPCQDFNVLNSKIALLSKHSPVGFRIQQTGSLYPDSQIPPMPGFWISNACTGFLDTTDQGKSWFETRVQWIWSCNNTIVTRPAAGGIPWSPRPLPRPSRRPRLSWPPRWWWPRSRGRGTLRHPRPGTPSGSGSDPSFFLSFLHRITCYHHLQYSQWLPYRQCCGSGSAGSVCVLGLLDPDPLVRGTRVRIRLRILL